ncbi:hypothetical protein N0V86_008488 [Didymella sp. IMI 355093]|nr:hypothetical protein N0V86_008488 [Didymella sp. IMI 355093]
MKSSILIASTLATGAFAWPKPQLLDVSLGLGAKVTVFSTVTVTQPATLCLPASATGAAVGQTPPKTSSSTPNVPPASTAAPAPQPTASKWLSLPLPILNLLPIVDQDPPKVSLSTPNVTPTSVAAPAQPTTSKWSSLPQTTSKPVPVVQTSWLTTSSKPTLVQSSSQPHPTPSTTPAPVAQVPSTGGRVTGTAQAYLSVGASYQAAILYHHNAARANHGATPLTWDASCEANARIAANTCSYTRYIPAGVSQGQNIYLSSTAAFNVTAAITESWYKSEFSSAVPWFGIASLPISILPGVEQLTQVLWKGTTKVGCASVDCGANMKGGATGGQGKYTVCNYASAGNVGGLFAMNVGRPVSVTSLGSWTD